MPPIRTASGSSGSIFSYIWVALFGLCLSASVVRAQTTTPAVSTIVALSVSTPTGNLVRGPDGLLYGVAVPATPVAGGLIYSTTLDGATVKTVFQIDRNEAVTPQAGLLLLSSDGKFYGTTKFGRATEATATGTIYRLNVDGTGFEIIHRFALSTTSNQDLAPKNTDGAYPEGELIDGQDGFLYGTTRAGGTNGTGTVFKVMPNGTGFTLLHEFGPITSTTASGLTVTSDGAVPVAPLLRGSDGLVYGTASSGGANGRGVLFRMSSAGTAFELLRTFGATTADATTGLLKNSDGATPLAGLTDGGDGYLYGVTSSGGTTGAGVVFAIAPATLDFKVQHHFDVANGSRPNAELLLGTLDTTNKLYGTTAAGGQSSTGATTSFGTIFSVLRVADGLGATRLYSFDNAEGSSPNSRLIEIGSDKFVGTTTSSGKCGYGTVFQYSGAGDKVTGNTECGRTKARSGGGSIGPALLVLLGGFAWARRRRRRRNES